ncbi:hypothetical protein ACRYCC_31595 [Actinomadura scrupuli]|uniref:hypothetical protein n=1 Tax=Actinomadura scrupuli TaxID=559629 RepID=UPI003D96CD0F
MLRRFRAAVVTVCTGVALIPGGIIAGSAQAAACAPLSASATREDLFWNPLFNGYGNDNSSLTDWTAADSSISVKLPSGIGANANKVVWLFNDTLLGEVKAPPNPSGAPYRWHAPGKQFARNSAVVQEPTNNWLVQTLYGGGAASAPLPWIRHPQHPAKRYELLGAAVEPATPGSSTQRLKVMLLEKDDSNPPFGGDLGYAVAVFDPADLTAPLWSPVRFDAVDLGRGKIYWGVSVVPHGSYRYIWGESSQTVNGDGGSNAYLARAAAGDLDDPWQWQFWNGSAWTAAGRQDLAQPVIPFTGAGDGQTGVAHGFGVQEVTVGGTTRYALTTMDPTAGVGVFAQLTMYTICDITDPRASVNPVLFGKNRFYVAPEATNPKPAGFAEYTPETVAYMPALHPEFTHSTGLLLSYSINDIGGQGLQNILENVNRYRPRFLRVAVG